MQETRRQIEDLQCKGLKIIQDKSLYTFSSDSVILANFINLKKNDKALEIGAGSGVISILLSAKTNFQKIVAYEAQDEMFDLLKDNIALNHLEDKIEILHDKVQNFQKHFAKHSFDVAFSNPPYMKTTQPLENVRQKARHDQMLPIDELCQSAKDILKDKGKFFVVYTSERSCELIACLQKYNLIPKTIFFTENGKGRVVLIVIEAVKNGGNGVKVLPNLVTNDLNGDYLEKLQTHKFLND